MRYEQKSGTEGAAEGVTDFVIVYRVSQFKYLAYLKKKKTQIFKTQTSTYRCRFSSHKIRPAFQCGYSTNEGLF